MFRAADIERNLRRATDSSVWQRGKQYYARRAVRALSYETDPRYPLFTVSARVRGSQLYQTHITINVDESEVVLAGCDCPYAQDDEYCKHVAALGLALCARMRAIFGDGEIDMGTGDLVTALESGHPPAKKASLIAVANTQSTLREAARERLAAMGFDMSLVTDTLLTELALIMPKADEAVSQPTSPPAFIEPTVADLKIPFQDRYALILQLKYETPQAWLTDTTAHAYSWQNDIPLSRIAIRSIMDDSRIELTETEHAFLSYLSKHDSWSNTFDLHHLLVLSHSASVPAYQDSYNTKKRMHFVTPESPMPVVVRLVRQELEPYSTSPIARPSTRFEVSTNMTDMKRWTVGASGFVSFDKRSIALYPANIQTCALMKRICSRRQHYQGADFPENLSDSEVIAINEIITDLARCVTLSTDLTPEFAVTSYEKAEPVLVVDYDAAGSRLSLRGAVDYGCELFDVSEAWYSQSWSTTVQITRRTDPKLHPLIVTIEGTRIGYADVNPKKEAALYRALYQQYGFNKHSTLTLSGTKRIEQFLRDMWTQLEVLGWKIVFTHDEIKYSSADVRTDIAADLDATKDWLAFDLSLYCGEERVRLQDVVAFIERGDECLKTEDGRLIRVTNRADLERLVRMLERFAKNEATGKFEGKLYNAPEVADIASNSPHYRTQFAKSFKTFMTEVQSGKPVAKVKLPAAHKKLLRPYQAQGVEWMHFLRSYRFGGILADEMGLGKTIQALSHISMHTDDGESSLVVCPKTLLHNWAREAATRFPELSVAVVEGTATERKALIMQKPTKKHGVPHLLITSYPLAQRDIEFYKARKSPFHYLLLDEAQSIKNPRTKNAHAVKAIPAEYRLALTGTPLENSVEELWSVFDFLMPGFLGHHASFQKHFGKPIMEHGNAGALAQLKSKTSAFMIRRTKAEVLKELPPKIETTMSVELNDDQNVLYQEVLARTKTELFQTVEKQGFKRSQIHILAALTKLRQICNHPNLVEPDGTYSSGKLDTCMEIVREIQSEGRKVLIFSQFTSMLDIIGKQLREEKVSFSMLTGKTKHRQALVDSFNADPSITAFLISLKAGGTGLNLTSADTVIVFDPWWNPAVENQAIDRAHRIGQKKTVNVYRLVTQGTIEEKILSLQGKKRALFDALVQENADLFKKLTWDDVQSLFRS